MAQNFRWTSCFKTKRFGPKKWMDDHSETILIIKGQKQYANHYSVLTLAFCKKYTAAGKYGIHLLEFIFWDCKHVCCYPGYYLFAHSYSLFYHCQRKQYKRDIYILKHCTIKILVCWCCKEKAVCDQVALCANKIETEGDFLSTFLRPTQSFFSPGWLFPTI